MKPHTIRITIPKEVVKEARRMGMNESEIRKTVETFTTLQLISVFSKLTRRDAEELSRKIKWTAWKKLKRRMKK